MTERTTELGEAELRRLLFSIAHRMLGTVGDAEDVVQEAFLRLARLRQEGTRVENARAFLRRSRPGWRSTSSARRGRAARRTSGRGCPNR